MISSVPYVPPDTMKNVAATSGQSVSFAALFLVVGMTREVSWVGSDKELNFYSRPPKGTRSRRCGRVSSHSQHTRVAPACKKKNASETRFLCLAKLYLRIFCRGRDCLALPL